MTRPRKATVDFFPHYCTHGKTMYVLDEQYGIHGYYFWFRLLEYLGNTENHFIDISNPATWRYLLSITKSTEEKAKEILKCLSDMEAIDPKLWEDGVIWSQNFVDGVAAAYRNRTQEIPKRPVILRKKSLSEGVNVVNQAKISADEPNLTYTNLDEPRKKLLSTDGPVDRTNGFKISNLAELWNEKAPPELARVAIPFKRSPKKLKPMTAMVSLYPDQGWWEALIAKTYHSSFMRGHNPRGWKATFDFVVSKADEINDGKYIDHGITGQANQRTAINLKNAWEFANE